MQVSRKHSTPSTREKVEKKLSEAVPSWSKVISPNLIRRFSKKFRWTLYAVDFSSQAPPPKTQQWIHRTGYFPLIDCIDIRCRVGTEVNFFPNINIRQLLYNVKIFLFSSVLFLLYCAKQGVLVSKFPLDCAASQYPIKMLPSRPLLI